MASTAAQERRNLLVTEAWELWNKASNIEDQLSQEAQEALHDVIVHVTDNGGFLGRSPRWRNAVEAFTDTDCTQTQDPRSCNWYWNKTLIANLIINLGRQA